MAIKTYPFQPTTEFLRLLKAWSAISGKTVKDFLIEAATEKAARENLVVSKNNVTEEVK